MKKSMQKALQFEKKGYDIYKETAEKSKNPILKNIFNYLAEQELNHITEITGYLEGKGIKIKGDNASDTKEFFLMTVSQFKKNAELSEDDEKAYETALKLEQNSYDFYKLQLEKTDNPELKDFFEFLMEQENAHYEFIEKIYSYTKDPENFNAEEEKWMFEG